MPVKTVETGQSQGKPQVQSIGLRTEPQGIAIHEIRQRIALCRENPRKSNCVGTALYIIKEQEEDRPMSGYGAHDYLSELKQIEKPVVGCLISWEIPLHDRTVIRHAGIVTSTEPLLIAHRAGPGADFVENEPFSGLDAKHGMYSIHRFYLPKILDE